MNYKSATNTQLYTIAYHEPCTRAVKLSALQELDRRRESADRRNVQARIKRKMK